MSHTLPMMHWAVQTPLQLPNGLSLRAGESVYFRPTKAGEIAERFDHYVLLQSSPSLSTSSSTTVTPAAGEDAPRSRGVKRGVSTGLNQDADAGARSSLQRYDMIGSVKTYRGLHAVLF